MSQHAVVALWVRPAPGAALESRPELTVEEGRGIAGDHTLGRRRHVTIVFEDDWNAAARTLGKTVDPVGRRANVLVRGGDGRRYVGSTVRLGEVLLEIKGTVAPCDVMERAAAGLREALEPDGRGGIWGRALSGGRIRLGDALTIAQPAVEGA